MEQDKIAYEIWRRRQALNLTLGPIIPRWYNGELKSEPSVFDDWNEASLIVHGVNTNGISDF